MSKMFKSFDMSKMLNMSQNRMYITISILLGAVILLVLFAGHKKVPKRWERFTNEDGISESQKAVVDQVVSGKMNSEELTKQIKEGKLTQDDLNSIISYVSKMSDTNAAAPAVASPAPVVATPAAAPAAAPTTTIKA